MRMMSHGSITFLGRILILMDLLIAWANGSLVWAESAVTPIKHLIVVFQENVSFDHYFATYPKAFNRPGEARFEAAPDTPSINGLTENAAESQSQ